MMLKKVLKRFFQGKIERKALFLIIFGSLSWSLTMVKSGIKYDFGMGFWGPNGHDGVWHISLSRSLAGGTWEMPIIAGEYIKNYHIGFDLLLAVIHKMTFIPITNLYFQIIPPVLALLTGFYVYRFVYLWKKDKNKAFWSTFFIYFGGGLGWVVTLIRSGVVDGESMFWSQQSVSTLTNPPFALSVLVIFSACYYLVKGMNSNDKKSLSISSFLFGVLIIIKVYAGILCLGALFVSGIIHAMKRKGLALIKVFAGASVLSTMLFLPLFAEAGGAVVFKPFWFLETMMTAPDRLYYFRFAQAMANYKEGGVWIKFAASYFIAFVIFIMGNFGTRIICLAKVNIKKAKNINSLDAFFIFLISAGIILPTFFVQKNTAWNTIQFLYYSLFFSGVAAGMVFSDTLKLFKSKIFSTTIVFLLMAMTTPATLGTLLRHYLPERPPAKLSHEEIEALRFLSKQPEGTVLTNLFDKDKADEAVQNPPRPLYLYESTAYVSAFSGKKVFLEDEVNLEIMEYNWRERKESIVKAMQADDIKRFRYFLKENDIKYIYGLKSYPDLRHTDGLEKIFENGEIIIYKVYDGV